MPKLVLGVDGGGTKTLAAIADENGRVLGIGRAGPANHDDASELAVVDNLDGAVRQAFAGAGLERRQFDSVFLGLAGVVSDADRERVRKIVRRTGFAGSRSLEFDHDIRIALAGGLAGGPGVVVIAGTGAACYGRDAAGRSWQAGGWGHLLADEGSGYWLGLNALKAALRMHDGRLPESSLQARMLELLGLQAMHETMHRLYVQGMSRTEIAALAPHILQLAREGDETCLSLVAEGAGELAGCVEAVARKLEFVPSQLAVTYSGGMLGRDSPLRSRFLQALAVTVPASRSVEPLLPPVLGACLLALGQLGADHDAVVENLRRPAAGQ